MRVWKFFLSYRVYQYYGSYQRKKKALKDFTWTVVEWLVNKKIILIYLYPFESLISFKETQGKLYEKQQYKILYIKNNTQKVERDPKTLDIPHTHTAAIYIPKNTDKSTNINLINNLALFQFYSDFNRLVSFLMGIFSGLCRNILHFFTYLFNLFT